jgi:hypothetical protein
MSTFHTLGLPALAGHPGVGHYGAPYEFTISSGEGVYGLWIPNERVDRCGWDPLRWEQQQWIVGAFGDRLDGHSYLVSWQFKDADALAAFVDAVRPFMEGPLPEWLGEQLHLPPPPSSLSTTTTTLVTRGLPSFAEPLLNPNQHYVFTVVAGVSDGKRQWVIQLPEVDHRDGLHTNVDEQRAWLSRELSTAPGAHWQGTDLVLASVMAREWFLERVALALVDERIGAVRQRLGSA